MPELSKSPASTPIPPRALPSSLNATPARTATSSKRPSLQVAIQLVRLRVVGDQQIGPAVPVIVEHGDARATSSCYRRCRCRPSRLRTCRCHGCGTASRSRPRYASGVQYCFCLPSMLQNTSCVRRPLHVVAHEQVEQPIPIVIEPQRRAAETLPAAEARLVRDIDECVRGRCSGTAGSARRT